ncbi:MAG: OstA-like protein [Chitinophagaceae bacterium]
MYFKFSKKKRLLALIIICSIFINKTFAQRTAINDSTPQGKRIEFIKAERYNRQVLDSNKVFLSLAGNAIVQQDKTLFYADSILLNERENTLEAFGNVHINDADSIHTYAQYVKYLGKEKRAFLKNKVRLTDGKGTLTTNDLTYDVGIKIGTYVNGGKIVNGKTTLTSTEGYYYGDVRDVYFKRKVILINPEYKIYTDTLLYNLNTEIANFVCPTKILNGKRTITTKEGFYDLKTKKGKFLSRSQIDDSTYTFTADKMAMEDSSGFGEFIGNAVYKTKDSLNGQDLIANNIKTNKKTNTFLATQKPILLIRQDADTTYISADTLYSGRLTDIVGFRNFQLHGKAQPKNMKFNFNKDSSNNRFFEAYYNVKIYNDSLQANADSMFYSSYDSVFRLMKNPIAWARDNQLTGDTIYLFTKKQKPHKLEVWENAISISKVAKTFYNQVRGNTINGFFKNGQIDTLIAKGTPAENVYYAEDEYKKLIGVNSSTCDVITVNFLNNKPQRVVFVNNLAGTMYPIKQVNHESIRVKGFLWLDDKRPKSKFDILGN